MSKSRLTLTGGAALTLSAACVLLVASHKQPAAVKAGPSAAQPPSEIYLTGVVRDFKEYTVSGGHPDFERQPDNGFGRYSGNIAPTLDDDGKPKWVGGGRKVTTQWRDSQNRPICHTLYDPTCGDKEGAWGTTSSGGVTGEASFNQWFRDVPGVNLSAPLTLRLVRDASTGTYVFDDKLDPDYIALAGFFPIDDQLFGNSPGTPQHNYHFTFELHTEFTYDASANQVFQFIGDDDVYVFIDNKLVIDLGGVHAALDQFVDLNRLGLTDGETYRLDFFFAERHRTQSNFRIQTNLQLQTPAMPTITSSFD